MSSDLQWLIVRKYNKFLIRNGSGDRSYFSTVSTNTALAVPDRILDTLAKHALVVDRSLLT